MNTIARIIGVSLLTAGLGVALGAVLFGQNPDNTGVYFILACVGAIVGAVAGAAHEVVTARR